ncbi:uncharacterized protein DUF3231 [Tumebacillus sp. BK434]|uniref:DUF3231 family protein n=1 Tax=Tumebacillus sp. BK434 TaxID=2512169 RepID=UPI0010514CA8|nr:DUF3231 family protein [Tumebacillus sp. BK434]TCP57591.1 uncharacterized protein DUF3231 [Tumebacillus sp. BK434]
MADIMEAVANALKALIDDDPKPPLHVLEVGNCWAYLAYLGDALSVSQQALNMTSDEDLSSAIHEELELVEIQKSKLQAFMIDEGIPLPPMLEQVPKCRQEDIPPGVKQTDYEIANALSLKIAFSIIACAKAISEAVRVDFGIMFTQFLGQKIVYGTTLRAVMKQRGWLKVPPAYNPPGRPQD